MSSTADGTPGSSDSPGSPEVTGISLRRVVADDAQLLLRIYSSTRADELALTNWSDDQKAQFCLMQFAAQSSHYGTHYPNAQHSVIERDGTPVGRLYVDRGKDDIRIVDIALLPEARGAGIGTKLLRELIAEAESAGKPLSIHVEKFNPALRLYLRLGFVAIEDKEVYLLMERRPGAA